MFKEVIVISIRPESCFSETESYDLMWNLKKNVCTGLSGFPVFEMVVENGPADLKPFKREFFQVHQQEPSNYEAWKS